MAAGQGDLEGPARLRLPADVGEVHDRLVGRRTADAGAAPRSSIRRRCSTRQRRRPGARDRAARTTSAASATVGHRRRLDPGARRPRRPPRPARRPGARRAARAPRPSAGSRARGGPRRPGRARRSARSGPGPARTCSDPSRMPSAIARSSDAPALRTSAGARFTVIRRGGWWYPALRSAPRTRSRASESAASGRPTIVNPGRPGATSTSTRTTRPAIPLSVAESSVASTGGTLAAATHPRLIGPRERRPAGSGRARPAPDRRELRDRRRPRCLVDGPREVEHGPPQRPNPPCRHERRPAVERARSRPGTR